MDYTKKPPKERIQVRLDPGRVQQLTKLAELTGSSISRIIRLALDSKHDEFEAAIKKARLSDAQDDWL